MININFNKNSSIYSICFFTVIVSAIVLILNFVHHNLAGKIENAKQQEIHNILSQNMPCEENYQPTELNGEELFYCKGSNIIAMHNFSKGYIDKIEYIGLFNILENTVTNITIINHKETPGLGDKITSAQWLQTIYNKSAKILEIKKYGGQIDSFTSASVTPLFFLANLRANLNWLETNKPQIIKIIK